MYADVQFFTCPLPPFFPPLSHDFSCLPRHLRCFLPFSPRGARSPRTLRNPWARKREKEGEKRIPVEGGILTKKGMEKRAGRCTDGGTKLDIGLVRELWNGKSREMARFLPDTENLGIDVNFIDKRVGWVKGVDKSSRAISIFEWWKWYFKCRGIRADSGDSNVSLWREKANSCRAHLLGLRVFNPLSGVHVDLEESRDNSWWRKLTDTLVVSLRIGNLWDIQCG